MTSPVPIRRSVFAGRLRDLPELIYTEDRPDLPRGRWRDVFRPRIEDGFDGRLVLEIGCFDAEFLGRVAAKFPHTAFVGLDWKAKAIYEGARRIASLGLKNVLLLHGRARALRRTFGDGELNEIWVFHPDPFDAESELKNRLMNDDFLRDAHATLADASSTLSLKTDHAGYFQWTLDAAAARKADFQTKSRSTDYWNDPAALAATAGRAFAGETTPFERRFVARKQPIYWLDIRKK